MNVDVTLLPIADTHTGSTTALHPDVKRVGREWKSVDEIGGWGYIDNPQYRLTSKQKRIWKHLEKCLVIARQKRENEKLIMLMVGDSHDGFHHGTHQLVTTNIGEQVNTHIHLMHYIQEQLGWRRGDGLYYITGTDCHTGDEENNIAAQLGGYQYPDNSYSTSFLEMEINGRWIWAYHQGVGAGKYPNKGNAMRIETKRIYYQCKAVGKRVPDLIITAHTHEPHHEIYVNDERQAMHYIVLPSWQDKTRHANDKLPTAVNRVGMQIIKISAAGLITVDNPILLTAPMGSVVRI